MRNIFSLCGLCGYLFIPIKMYWPAWRLYDFVLLVLAYFTWKYAWGAKDLKVLYAELGRTNRLQAELDKTREESRQKSFFLNAVSHDLRTPLNGLTLQASLAEIGLASGDDDAVRQAVAGMKSSARATADLLESLLDYTRLDWISEPNNSAQFSLKDAVEAACITPRAMAVKNGLTLANRVPGGLMMTTDRVKFERVLGNLLSNAVKFTRTGGVRVEAQRSGHDLELHVIDTGIGIAPEHQDRIFEEFFQVHNHERDRSKGFGLGLPIARRLARQLGGDIHLESTNGGSRFTVVLPGALREPATVANGQPTAGEPAAQTVGAG
jgi:signal transduction histidine kinase